MSQLLDLQKKVKNLKGSAKTVVERKIEELIEQARLKGTPRTTCQISIITSIDSTDNSLKELETALELLEARLSAVLPIMPVNSMPTKDESHPAALSSMIFINERVKNLTSKITRIMEEVVL